MSESIKRTDVNALGEFGLIDHLTANHSLNNKSSKRGIGDDAAVMSFGDKQTVVSTDMLVEGIHFDMAYTPLKHLGYKAVVVNLSDIYAMNARPKQITVSLALSNRYSVEALEELYKGIYAACEYYKVDLVGGDTTSSPKGLVISITAIGEANAEDIVYRDGAKVGDLICISGNLGAAYLGLQILEREKQVFLADPNMTPEVSKYPYLVQRLLKPEARFDIIDAFMVNKIKPTSMIDISDGLASELFHICTQSNVGAFLEESGISVHPDTEMQAIDFKIDPATCALSGGEDYELLFTIDPKDVEKVKYIADVYIAGEIVEKSEGIKLHSRGGNIHPITAQGWKHF